MASSRAAIVLALAIAVALPASAAGTPDGRHLNRIYRGDDGSALYTRQVGQTLYAFGEHPGRGTAFVLAGTVEGSAVKDTRYWFVPKGRAQGRGTIELRWSQAGARLVRITPGSDLPAVWQAIPPGGIQWPNKTVAGFQNPSPSNLTGAFAGAGSRAYLTEDTSSPGAVVGVVEQESQPGERPGVVIVLVGTRSGTTVTGAYADVPKGASASRQGSFALTVGANRRLTLGGVVSRSMTLDPDYALDFGRFAKRVEDKLAGNAVGWSYAIAQHGIVVVRKAGGQRLLAANGGPKPFTVRTKSQAASTSKTMSAALLLRVLGERGISVDARVAPYLPSCWRQGKGVSELTFRDLLAHRTRFDDGRVDCSDPYECLRKVIELGAVRRSPAYQNVNYALLRPLVPLVDDPARVRAIFESRGCANENDAINQAISSRFWARLKRMLDPHGVDFAFYVGGSADYACVYDHRSRRTKGVCPRPDFHLRAGAGYVAISAWDFVEFLSALDRGLIVPKATAEAMKTGFLGFDSTESGVAGAYVWKSGACPGSRTGIGCSALAMIFPGGVQAYAITNSGRNATGSLADLLERAFDAALK
ncbi:MAG TPA: serine hydrolase domain-containing protein [Gaiellaceae bacterium]|nr:serine hydrolase domain-containing protein [Gaiellaceae bacterium]